MVETPGTPVRPDADDLRPLNGPVPTQVIVKGARLLALVIEGKAVGVAELQDTWLSQDEWWRPRPIDRQYVAVVLENGRYLVLYHDRIDGRWYTQHHSTP